MKIADDSTRYILLQQAVILLDCAQRAMLNRRIFEQACGYPEDYGESKLLLGRIKLWCEDKTIKQVREDIKVKFGKEAVL